MSRKVKCPECGIYFIREEEDGVLYKNRWYHKKCYDTYWEIESVRLELIDFILPLFKIKSPGPRIYGQIKNFIENKGLTYKGILQALKYFYEVKKNNTEKSNSGIGIVPYVYVEAQNYYKNKEDRDNRIASEVAQYKKVIDSTGKHIVIQKEKITQRKKKKRKEIDIDTV